MDVANAAWFDGTAINANPAEPRFFIAVVLPAIAGSCYRVAFGSGFGSSLKLSLSILPVNLNGTS
jgi:hypothetical protein